VLPLKIKKPKWFDGTGLVVGSFVPDLKWFLTLLFKDLPIRSLHSIGDTIYMVPFSLVLVVILDKVLFPTASFLASKNRLSLISNCLSYFGVDEWHLQRNKELSVKWFVKTSSSIIIGVLSHFMLDLPTHGQITYLQPFYTAEMPAWFLIEYSKLNLPLLGEWEVTNYNLLWLLFSFMFALLALYQLRYIKKHKLLIKWQQL
ncbi:MAG: DUF4184 family protein, partial [Candidatus Jordarchaeaceae archaeon]